MQEKHIKSFYNWCIENNKQDLLDRWDYELNKCSPKEVSYGSNNKYYFKCSTNLLHKSKLVLLNNISNKNNQVLCDECNSIAQWGIDNVCKDFLEKYWDYEKNIKSPWKIYKSSAQKIWIICQKKDYHDSYEISCAHFIEGKRCPYCKGFKVHPKDSFAQYHIDHTDLNFLEKYWDWEKNNELGINPWNISPSSNKSIWIRCQEKDYHGNYKLNGNDFMRGKRCSYCGNNKIHPLDSLGSLYPEVITLWSNNNSKSSYEYSPNSNKKVWWKCPDGKHEDYLRRITDSKISEFRCPNCTIERDESFLQEKVRLYLEQYNNKYSLLHEKQCTLIPINPKTKCKLPFDNEVTDLRLIIEVNGIQHYLISSYKGKWFRKNLTPEEQLHKQKLHDRYKKYIAFCSGYSYLEIPYWTEKDESYKQLIDSKINEILKLQQIAS